MTAIAIHKAADGIRFYGPAADFWSYKGPEAMLTGPYQTGKTLAALSKLHALCVKYANTHAFIMRKTYQSLVSTALVTFEKKVLPIPADDPASQVKRYGGEKPVFYDYPNGSRILCAGLDNPDKILSGEFDFGYVNQSEEISLDAWEKLSTRCSGRAGHAPYSQLFGDCNPAHPQHWILHRARLTLFEQLHRHNPTLVDQTTGELTVLGIQTMEVLDGLTGLRKLRGKEGKWVSAEGVVYDTFDSSIGGHVINRDKVPEITAWYLSCDFGYTNPFQCGLWGTDHDGRLYLWAEIYMTRRTINAHIPAIKAMIGDRHITAIIADHDAEDRATLAEHGFSTIAAKKDISVGIQAVQERLKVQADGKPRLYVCKDALVEADRELYREYPGDLHPCCTEHEFAVYQWPESRDGKSDKEAPLDYYNHGMDSLRYMCMYLSRRLIITESSLQSV